MAAQRFASAAASVALRAESLDDEYAQRVLVTLFGLYQQATVGDCIEAPPRRFGSTAIERRKW